MLHWRWDHQMGKKISKIPSFVYSESLWMRLRVHSTKLILPIERAKLIKGQSLWQTSNLQQRFSSSFPKKTKLVGCIGAIVATEINILNF